MAMNPMQRKANNYLLIGILVTLLIATPIIAFLFMQLSGMKKQEKARLDAMKSVTVSTREIKAGNPIYPAVVADSTEKNSEVVDIDTTTTKPIKVSNDAVPQNYVSTIPETAIAKIDIPANSIITQDMFYIDEQDASYKDTREVEFTGISLPSNLVTGDYIDIRLRIATGQDYVVLSRKRVVIPTTADGSSLDIQSVRMRLNETEIVIMDSAIVESYIMSGCKLYATLYTDPGSENQQKPLEITYIPSDVVYNYILLNSEEGGNNNIEKSSSTTTSQIQQKYNQRNGQNKDIIRNAIEALKQNQEPEDQLDAVNEGTKTEIDSALEKRQNYLTSLGGSY